MAYAILVFLACSLKTGDNQAPSAEDGSGRPIGTIIHDSAAHCTRSLPLVLTTLVVLGGYLAVATASLPSWLHPTLSCRISSVSTKRWSRKPYRIDGRCSDVSWSLPLKKVIGSRYYKHRKSMVIYIHRLGDGLQSEGRPTDVTIAPGGCSPFLPGGLIWCYLGGRINLLEIHSESNFVGGFISNYFF